MSPRTGLHLLALSGLVWMPAIVTPWWSEQGERTKARLEVENSIGMKLTLIPKGRFKMGSPGDEVGRNKDEEQHDVDIANDFYLGIYEVTQKQFANVMGFHSSYFAADAVARPATAYEAWSKPGGGKDQVKDLGDKGGFPTGDFPVENVSWDEAVEFCNKLSALPEEQKAKRTYRLPTEEEWEYACRGGAATYQVFHFGKRLSSDLANFRGTTPYGGAEPGPFLERTCKVGSYKPNGFGLFDMHGNVWEWCSDAFEYQGDRSFRTRRGGSWGDVGDHCRSAIRLRRTPDDHRWNLGFRAVLVVPATGPK